MVKIKRKLHRKGAKLCVKCGSRLWHGNCINRKCKLTSNHEEEDE